MQGWRRLAWREKEAKRIIRFGQDDTQKSAAAGCGNTGVSPLRFASVEMTAVLCWAGMAVCERGLWALAAGNTGVSPLRFASVEMTAVLCWAGMAVCERGLWALAAGNTGVSPLRFASVEMTGIFCWAEMAVCERGLWPGCGEYRGLSTSLRFGRDDGCFLLGGDGCL